MTEERLPLAELLAKAGDGDFLRSVAEAVVHRRGPELADRPG
jgi:putative transposase